MIGDGICQTGCQNEECNFDARDCECDVVLQAEAGYRTDGSWINVDYQNSQSRCWLIRPKRPNATKVNGV